MSFLFARTARYWHWTWPWNPNLKSRTLHTTLSLNAYGESHTQLLFMNRYLGWYILVLVVREIDNNFSYHLCHCEHQGIKKRSTHWYEIDSDFSLHWCHHEYEGIQSLFHCTQHACITVSKLNYTACVLSIKITLTFHFLLRVHPSLSVLLNSCSQRSPSTWAHSPTMMIDLAELSKSWFCNVVIVPPENKNRHSGSTDVAMK